MAAASRTSTPTRSACGESSCRSSPTAEATPRSRSRAQQRAARWPQDPKAVSPDVRGGLLDTAARTAGRNAPALYAHFVAAASAAKDAAERRDIIRAIGSFRDPAIAGNARELILTGPFDPVEALEILGSQLQSDANRSDALAWLDARYDSLAARGAQDDFDVLPNWARGGCSAAERSRFVTAFAQRMQTIDGGPRSYAKALERDRSLHRVPRRAGTRAVGVARGGREAALRPPGHCRAKGLTSLICTSPMARSANPPSQ